MTYSRRTTSESPSLFVFLLDQSSSMEDPFGGDASGPTKAHGVADAVNAVLSELTMRAATTAEQLKPYFDIAVIGYGGGEDGVRPALTGPLAGRDLVSIVDIAPNFARMDSRTRKIPDGAGGVLEQEIKFPVWVEPLHMGGTPMAPALNRAADLAREWLTSHPDSFPPIVLNVTDGEENVGGDALPPAAQLMNISTADGEVLLFNLHLSSHRSAPVLFPLSPSGLADEFARKLFEMSSVLPEPMRAAAEEQGFKLEQGARGFGFNADLTSVVQFLKVGTLTRLEAGSLR